MSEQFSFSPQKTLRHAQDICEAGLAPSYEKEGLERVEKYYATAIPEQFRDLIENTHDPIAKQVIPTTKELVTTAGEQADPIGDERYAPMKGLIHRYEDRVLLKPILICPLYCRFCFRREQVGGTDDAVLDEASLQAIFQYIRRHKEIREVILSGGDPLMLSPRRLEFIIKELNAIDHIQIIRIHTRVPVATPLRVTQDLLAAMKSSKALWMAIHINHQRELAPKACEAIKKLVNAGIALIGQTVLLRDVNDTPQALEALLRAMVTQKIRPYYLHQLDKAPGTSHFHVPLKEGLALLRQLRGRVTGLAWPTYVYDIPGGYGKVPLGPQYLVDKNHIYDRDGHMHKIDDI